MIEKLLATMKDRGLTQSQVESLCALSDDRISKWKNGQGEPTARQILRIADLLNVPVRYLIDDTMDRPEPDVTEAQQRVLWLADQVGYDAAVKRLALVPETQAAPAVGDRRGAERVPDPKSAVGDVVTIHGKPKPSAGRRIG